MSASVLDIRLNGPNIDDESRSRDPHSGLQRDLTFEAKFMEIAM
jgi:hypothetical protein